ncbi:protein translocase subunit SecF [Micromonospora sp. HM5-17]|jgi:preprotein translocase subunit SecF|uniref:protein translocase subunit SecF n=1 Tax=Micromonospora sp. HM5-17 TaxID=2487710 RepID=UPI000F47CB69|nr:protein translocase subunit SecF [Micromonospora sp. HM5-17]ROT33269.1 protein translocase subunit SecF [Micromonospora sp. HM5-17]
MSRSGLASRLYRGEAGLEIVPKRRLWFAISGGLVLLAVLSVVLQGFSLGIEFKGGNEFQVPTSVGTMQRAEDALQAALADESTPDGPAEVVSSQRVGDATYLFRTTPLDQEQADKVRGEIAQELGIQVDEVSDNRVSAAWGSQVTERALIGLLIFVALVTAYLVIRFELRMAIAAIMGLALNLVLTAGVYSATGFEVTPSTIVGFLTILGFALYDTVVVFDKIQENTRGITAGTTQTYAEAANLALNQTLMRSINTSVVALLPVGGLLFIGAGLLGAGTLKDLGLVLFVGMAAAFFSSIFLATPLLVTLKEQEPRIKSHTQRVIARRATGGRDGAAQRRPGQPRPGASADSSTEQAEEATASADAERAALAGAAPKVGARPAGGKRSGSRGGRSGGNRPGGKRR